jgi:hypothetical protein
MPTTLISIGYPQTLVQSVVYALPSKLHYIHSTLAVEISPDGTTWDALTNADTVGAYSSGSFIRCTTGAPVVSIKGT